MILSVSRRTDIPAFYSDWFYERIKEGCVYVRNPMNIHQISKIQLNPKVVDCIVFWTKNARPLFARLNEINDYKYYFQYTINPYNRELENHVPKKDNVIDTFKELSEKIGSNRMNWRYDPILMTNDINIDYHIKYFEQIAKRLSTYTQRCIISFVDNYQKTERNLKQTTARELTDSEIFLMVKELVPIAKHYGMEIQTCSEKIELANVGIEHGHCIDKDIVEELLGERIETSKDKNQRKECGCIQSIDIGEYNTCGHHCLYCYANFNKEVVEKKQAKHNSKSPLLIGNVESDDKIIERKVCPLKRANLLF